MYRKQSRQPFFMVCSEPTARCNAINLIPPKVEVEDEEDDDVVIVEEVKEPKSILQRMRNVMKLFSSKKK